MGGPLVFYGFQEPLWWLLVDFHCFFFVSVFFLWFFVFRFSSSFPWHFSSGNVCFGWGAVVYCDGRVICVLQCPVLFASDSCDFFVFSFFEIFFECFLCFLVIKSVVFAFFRSFRSHWVPYRVLWGFCYRRVPRYVSR